MSQLLTGSEKQKLLSFLDFYKRHQSGTRKQKWHPSLLYNEIDGGKKVINFIQEE